MRCPSCQAEIPDFSTACPACGAGIPSAAYSQQQPVYPNADQQPVYPNADQQPVYPNASQQPVYPNAGQQPVYPNAGYPNAGQQPVYPYTMQPQQSMGWFKFLIYFALFAGALVNLATGIRCMTGLIYGTGDAAKFVYMFYPSLHTVDIIFGILVILLAVFAVVTRFQLSGYKKIGPVMLYALYAANLVISVVYLIAVSAILKESTAIGSSLPSIGISVAFLIINILYFQKRKAMFNR